jgi:hypothetical protein
MTYNDNTAAQTLLFPIQRAEAEDLTDCCDTHVLYHQARLAVTEMTNTINHYKLEPTTNQLRILTEFNALAKQTGYPTLIIDFDNFRLLKKIFYF